MGQIASSHHQHNHHHQQERQQQQQQPQSQQQLQLQQHQNQQQHQQQNKTSNFSALTRKHSTYKSKVHYNTSVTNKPSDVQALGKDELALLRASIRKSNIQRPVTISELTVPPTHVIQESNLQAAKLATHARELSSLYEAESIENNNLHPPTIRITTTDGGGTVIRNGNEFYTVGDGYHKTDNCYYRGPNGKFYKFPSDSYHKMTDGCFQRNAAGTYLRLKAPVLKCPSNLRLQLEGGDAGGSRNSTVLATSSGSKKLKNQMLKLIRRTKSHTPATMRELQQEKQLRSGCGLPLTTGVLLHENGNDSSGNNGGGAGGSGGRGGVDVVEQRQKNKVVVTMIENGGLPIVATSKSSHKSNKTNKIDVSGANNSINNNKKVRNSKERVNI